VRRLLVTVLLALTATAAGAGSASAIDPATFAEVSSGIVRVKADCGRQISTGTGFLIGRRVVMTARHVVRGCRNIRVHDRSGWITVKNAFPWFEGDGSDIDVATLRLDRDSEGHVFGFRPGQAGVGLNVAAIGHPLGGNLGYSQGRIMFRQSRRVYVRLLGGEGGSGSPVVDGQGRVVAILQRGYGSEDVIGQSTAGVISGYDFSSRWVAWRRVLCKAYRYGGIVDCAAR
jgi:S1-C subfamily serine protease